MSFKKQPPKIISDSLLNASLNKEEVKEVEEKNEKAPKQKSDEDYSDEEDIKPEGLVLLKVGALVQYTNREKIRSKRSIAKAVEKVDSGIVRVAADIPKYIADQLSYMSKQSSLSQKDYVIKLLLEDMYKRGVFEEPRADS